ncbi:uncharacterized protein LOC131328405 [Rhododendron vialii]|uniref:uncharacterized protein LOC131328405 n=1 Tax=Rhododendron vialii TaxID=182163 RepID=UPI00265DF754|nr:uncharacterized protein LOC131328405 [Rhododendron vialii]
MPRIDPEIVEHRILLYPNAKPVKQKLRRMKPDWVLKINEEVTKQIDAGFLLVTEYPQWVINIVPIPKKDGRITVCVDFRDLNKASPKDDFPLPHIDVLDREKTTFVTECGTFCYRVMSFGLKNAGFTYQRATTTLLHDMIHKEVEVYVDDMIVKAKEQEGHLPALRKFFERIKKYRMHLNPAKCTFRVTAEKMLGFMITTCGIEVDPSKIKAILEMELPWSVKDVRSFLGNVQFISRFIAKLTSTCEPIFCLLKKGEPFKWDDKCQKAFEAIRTYLQNPLEEDDGVERAVHYLSKKMVGCEERYTPLEKTKSIKGRAVADFLADYPVERGEDAEFKFLDEDVMTLTEDVWKLYFDGAANQKGFGIDVLLIAPDGSHIPLAFKLNFEVTNNQAEYEAYIVGMEATIEIGIEKLEVVGDSNLVTFTHVPRLKNQFADALATLASMVEIPIGVKLRPIIIEQRDTLDIWRFVERGEYHTEASKKDKIALQRMAAQYIICGGILYRRSHCGMHKLCIYGAEARRVMEEIHEGVCGPHMNGMMLAKKILR